MRRGAYQTHVRPGKDPAVGESSVWAVRPRSLAWGGEGPESRKEQQEQRYHRDAADHEGSHQTEHHSEKQESERACKKPTRETS
jgi:hypothetical protein